MELTHLKDMVTRYGMGIFAEADDTIVAASPLWQEKTHTQVTLHFPQGVLGF